LFNRLDELLVPNDDPATSISESLKGQQSVMSVLKIMDESPPPGAPTGSILSERVRRLASQLSWPEREVKELLEGLESRRPQIVLTGPPGTGKTYCASLIANDLIAAADPPGDSDSCIHIVQFHPTYSYQEFIEGLQPQPSGSSFVFDWVDGVLKKIVAKIEDNRREGKSPRQVLIIDEINRANVPSVLGELMYLLEYRSKSVTLGSGRSFSLPEELIIIGTMNSADRSIRGLDLALRRRFDFVNVVPDAQVLRKHYDHDGRGKLSGISIDQLVDGFDRLNKQIELDTQSSDLMIGHSYLMERIMNRQVLERVWRQQLFPLIREYFLGSADLIGKYNVAKFWDA
jgi:5-methylcytosine-specific restriction protein B